MNRFELGAWNRQTNGSQHCLMPPNIGRSIIKTVNYRHYGTFHKNAQEKAYYLLPEQQWRCNRGIENASMLFWRIPVVAVGSSVAWTPAVLPPSFGTWQALPWSSAPEDGRRNHYWTSRERQGTPQPCKAMFHRLTLYPVYAGLWWLGSRVASVLDSAAMLSGKSLRQTIHTHHASVHQAAKLVAALLRVARVTAGLAESNGSLPPGSWLTSPAGWLPRTGISSRTIRSAIKYGLPFLSLS